MTRLKPHNTTTMVGVALGWLSVLGMGLTSAFIVWANWSFIVAGKGVGVYSVVFYIFAVLVTGLAWLISFWLYRNKALAVFYWLACLILMPLFLFFPVWFQTPNLN